MTTHEDPRPAKLGCTDPSKGTDLTQRLETMMPLPAPLAAHLEQCPACQLERHTFATLDSPNAALPPSFIDKLRNALGNDPPR